MCSLNPDSRQQALEALRGVYLQQMQVAESRRRAACLRVNEATSRASQLADATYNTAVELAKQARDGVVELANAGFLAATADALARYEAEIAEAQQLYREQCKSADERFTAAHQAAKEICDLEVTCAREILDVSLETCSDESAEQAAQETYKQWVDAAKAKFEKACSEAESAKRAEHAAARETYDPIMRPARDRYEEAIMPHVLAKNALTGPAQQQFSAAFNPLFDARQAARTLSDRENGAAHAAINELFVKERRARVLAWQKLMAAFDEFCSLDTDETT